jgi:hypothetical protein
MGTDVFGSKDDFVDGAGNFTAGADFTTSVGEGPSSTGAPLGAGAVPFVAGRGGTDVAGSEVTGVGTGGGGT